MKIEAYAKVNLTLAVGPLRADGYHPLDSIVLPISLSDTLEFIPAAEFSTDTGYPDDLILKAAAALARSVGHPLPAYAVKVKKRIPAGGGLGGGSADAAATLIALDRLWNLHRSPGSLAEIGAAVGSDVPALVLGALYRTAISMRGRGEIVAPAPEAVESVTGKTLVLVNPGVSASTREVYGLFDSLDHDLAAQRENHLELPAVTLYPAIAGALSDLGQAGAEGVMMSGSGATVFGFARSQDEAEAIAAKIGASGKYGIMFARPLLDCPVV